VDFEVLHVHLPVARVPEQYVDLVAFRVEVSVGDTEVAEDMLLLRLDPQLRVAANQVVVVVGDRPPFLVQV
jgi:hypothetical protein